MNLELNMNGESLLTLAQLTDDQMMGLVDLAIDLKQKKQDKNPEKEFLLSGKQIVLIFQKASTRTRCATVVAARDEGAHTEYLGQADIHFGKKESVADTARVLGRMFDGIMFRGFEHSIVQTLAEHAGIPVWNGLTDEWHPSQILADLMTAKEHFGQLKGLKAVYLGDGRNNVCNSLMVGFAKAGIDFVNCCPEELSPTEDVVTLACEQAAKNGSTVVVEHDPAKAMQGANIVYTDVWVSMGEEDKFKERVDLLKPYQVNMEKMEMTGNIEDNKVIFLHCLPAFHNNDTSVTEEIGALEVTDDVFEASFSKVFDEAENRMHTIKAMMVATLK